MTRYGTILVDRKRFSAWTDRRSLIVTFALSPKRYLRFETRWR